MFDARGFKVAAGKASINTETPSAFGGPRSPPPPSPPILGPCPGPAWDLKRSQDPSPNLLFPA